MGTAGVRWCRQVVLLMVLCGSISSSVRADQALDDYNLSVQLYRQSRWAFAGDGFRKFIKDYPNHEKLPLARLYLGLTLINQSEFEAAREVLRTFIKDYPQNQNLAQARYRVAECSYLLNDLPAAQAELQQYLKDYAQDPLVERALPYLGDVQLRLGDSAAAAATFATAVQRFPQGALVEDAQFGWAKALETQQQFEPAMAKYRQLAQGTGPRAAEAWFQVGSREFDTGKYAEAAEAYRGLIRKFPNSPLVADAHLNAGFALFRSQDFPGAISEFAEAAKDPERAAQARYWQALCLKSQRDYPQAIEAFTRLQSQVTTGPMVEAIAFQKGMCERLAGQTAAAEASLLAVVQRFPQGEYSDDALHFATEMALDAGQLATAKERLTLFAQQYPNSGLRLYQELLAGRLELAQAAALTPEAPAEQFAAHYNAAASRFERILKDSSIARTKLQARYYLAITRQLQGDHAQVLTLVQPLVAEVQTNPAAAEIVDVLVIEADSLLQTDQFSEAATAAQAYLQKAPSGRQTARALSIQAVALTRAGQIEASWPAIERLTSEFPQASVTAPTTLRLAELADQRSDWPSAAKLYERLILLSASPDYQAYGLRGRGWAEYQQRQFPAAVKSFAELEQKFPQHKLAAEAGYFRAEALREQGDLPAAATAYAETLQRYSPAQPAPAGAETEGAAAFAYRAGLQAARTLRQEKNVPAADAAYAEVLKRFPQPQHLDRLLDEWALLNYEAQRYEQADAIFRRLVKDVPDSELADNAQLSLAESDLIAGRFDAARAAFEQLRTGANSEPAVKERAHFQLLVLALEQRRWSDVQQLSTSFAADFPQSPSVGYARYTAAEAVLADPAASNEQLESVLKQLAELMQSLPADSQAWAPRLWVLAAEAQFRLKRYDDVALTVADLQKKLPQSPLRYQADEVLGRSYKQMAKFDEARKVLEQVLSNEAAFRTETAAKSQFLIAETWFLQEKWKEAFLAYQKVYGSYAFPEWQSAALLQSAKCDEQLGQLKEAIATYDRLIAEFPQSTHVEEARRRLEQAKLKSGPRQ